jgi:hypothetical protein
MFQKEILKLLKDISEHPELKSRKTLSKIRLHDGMDNNKHEGAEEIRRRAQSEPRKCSRCFSKTRSSTVRSKSASLNRVRFSDRLEQIEYHLPGNVRFTIIGDKGESLNILIS